MDKYSICILKGTRKIIRTIIGGQSLSQPVFIKDSEVASNIIRQKLSAENPCMIARLGHTELSTMVNYLGIMKQDRNIVKYIKGLALPWWWEPKMLRQMEQWSGFFPPTTQKIKQFCELMLEDMQQLDIMGSWLPEEFFFEDRLKEVQKVSLIHMEPYNSSNPWSRCLEKKRVLVVHPFAKLIEQQYTKRELLFENRSVLPEFELQTLAAVQSLGGEDNGFSDWFAALNWMKAEIDKRNFDICLLGCGAYGFPLAAHIKRTGRKSFHLGGALQLLFGIKGKRWENPNYPLQWGLPQGQYIDMFNEHWIRPTDIFRPINADKVEEACYW